MHELYELKDKLMEELKEYGTKKEMSTGSLDVVDKLAHTVKNLCKIIEEYEESGEYSMAADGNSYRGMPYYYDGMSYARGRGRNAPRDSMGRYSNNRGYSTAAEAADNMVHELHKLMDDAPDEKTKQEFQRFIKKIEQM